MTEWVPVDSRRVMTAVEAERVARFDAAVGELEKLTRRLPGVLALMRSDMAGQPRSALAGLGEDDEAPEPELWCWAHERSTRDCLEVGLVCSGEIARDVSDRTGEAGIIPDRAAADHKAMLRQLDRLASTAHQLLGLAAAYPTQAAERITAEAGPGDEVGTLWCRSCWKDGKRCEPVKINPATDLPYYTGLCLWCGRTRKAIGGNSLPASDQRGDPPTWLVAKHHGPDRVTPGDYELAAKAVPKPDGKGRRRGRR